MPIELAAMLAGAAAVSGLVDSTLKLVDSIRSRFSGSNNEAKDKLEAELEKLRQGVGSVGQLAESADSYLEALEEIRHLQVDVLLLDQYLANNGDPLRNHLSPLHEASWRAVEQLVDVIDRDRDLPTQVHLNRKDWFDVADDQMLGSRLNDVNAAYGLLAERVKTRRYADVGSALEALQKPLREIDVLLRGTLADRILAGLKQLRRTGTGGGG
jgi:hypothetical protein